MKTFTTRTQVVNHLVEELGMPRPMAKVAVDQQYNYDQQPDSEPSDDLLRGNHEDLTISHTLTEEEVKMIRPTWDDMLSIKDNAICVDGEPTYDLEGDLLK